MDFSEFTPVAIDTIFKRLEDRGFEISRPSIQPTIWHSLTYKSTYKCADSCSGMVSYPKTKESVNTFFSASTLYRDRTLLRMASELWPDIFMQIMKNNA